MIFPKSEWRLILHPAGTGAWNMAVDEAVLETIGKERALPTLRLYAWDPPCLSIGYAQHYKEVDMNRLQALGWQLVRRPTGGRAILHADELTYAVVAPLGEARLAGGVLESYQQLSKSLLHAFHSMGIPAQASFITSSANQTENQNSRLLSPLCFEVLSNFEITVEGKKLVGSAQARRINGILQHGSLPLFGDLGRIAEVMTYPAEGDRKQAAAQLLSRATTVEAILGSSVSWDQAAQAFIHAFAETLNLKFIQAELSNEESQRALELQITKYSHPTWTSRV